MNVYLRTTHSGVDHKILLKTNALIGRSKECNLRIPALAVSRQHCRIEIKADEISITDLGSSNGTKVNSVKLPEGKSQRLLDGDIIKLGGQRFTVIVSNPAIISPGVTQPLQVVADSDLAQTSIEDRDSDFFEALIGDEDPGEDLMLSDEEPSAPAATANPLATTLLDDPDSVSIYTDESDDDPADVSPSVIDEHAEFEIELHDDQLIAGSDEESSDGLDVTVPDVSAAMAGTVMDMSLASEEDVDLDHPTDDSALDEIAESVAQNTDDDDALSFLNDDEPLTQKSETSESEPSDLSATVIDAAVFSGDEDSAESESTFDPAINEAQNEDSESAAETDPDENVFSIPFADNDNDSTTSSGLDATVAEEIDISAAQDLESNAIDDTVEFDVMTESSDAATEFGAGLDAVGETNVESPQDSASKDSETDATDIAGVAAGILGAGAAATTGFVNAAAEATEELELSGPDQALAADPVESDPSTPDPEGSLEEPGEQQSDLFAEDGPVEVFDMDDVVDIDPAISFSSDDSDAEADIEVDIDVSADDTDAFVFDDDEDDDVEISMASSAEESVAPVAEVSIAEDLVFQEPTTAEAEAELIPGEQLDEEPSDIEEPVLEESVALEDEDLVSSFDATTDAGTSDEDAAIAFLDGDSDDDVEASQSDSSDDIALSFLSDDTDDDHESTTESPIAVESQDDVPAADSEDDDFEFVASNFAEELDDTDGDSDETVPEDGLDAVPVESADVTNEPRNNVISTVSGSVADIVAPILGGIENAAQAVQPDGELETPASESPAKDMVAFSDDDFIAIDESEAAQADDELSDDSAIEEMTIDVDVDTIDVEDNGFDELSFDDADEDGDFTFDISNSDDDPSPQPPVDPAHGNGSSKSDKNGGSGGFFGSMFGKKKSPERADGNSAATGVNEPRQSLAVMEPPNSDSESPESELEFDLNEVPKISPDNELAGTLFEHLSEFDIDEEARRVAQPEASPKQRANRKPRKSLNRRSVPRNQKRPSKYDGPSLFADLEIDLDSRDSLKTVVEIPESTTPSRTEDSERAELETATPEKSGLKTENTPATESGKLETEAESVVTETSSVESSGDQEPAPAKSSAVELVEFENSEVVEQSDDVAADPQTMSSIQETGADSIPAEVDSDTNCEVDADSRTDSETAIDPVSETETTVDNSFASVNETPGDQFNEHLGQTHREPTSVEEPVSNESSAAESSSRDLESPLPENPLAHQQDAVNDSTEDTQNKPDSSLDLQTEESIAELHPADEIADADAPKGKVDSELAVNGATQPSTKKPLPSETADVLDLLGTEGRCLERLLGLEDDDEG